MNVINFKIIVFYFFLGIAFCNAQKAIKEQIKKTVNTDSLDFIEKTYFDKNQNKEKITYLYNDEVTYERRWDYNKQGKVINEWNIRYPVKSFKQVPSYKLDYNQYQDDTILLKKTLMNCPEPYIINDCDTISYTEYNYKKSGKIENEALYKGHYKKTAQTIYYYPEEKIRIQKRFINLEKVDLDKDDFQSLEIILFNKDQTLSKKIKCSNFSIDCSTTSYFYSKGLLTKIKTGNIIIMFVYDINGKKVFERKYLTEDLGKCNEDNLIYEVKYEYKNGLLIKETKRYRNDTRKTNHSLLGSLEYPFIEKIWFYEYKFH